MCLVTLGLVYVCGYLHLLRREQRTHHADSLRNSRADDWNDVWHAARHLGQADIAPDSTYTLYLERTRGSQVLSRPVLHAFHSSAEETVRTQHADAYLSWLECAPYVRLMFDASRCRYNLLSSKAGSQARSQQVVSRLLEYLTYVLDTRKICSQETYLRRMAFQIHDHHHFQSPSVRILSKTR